MNPVFKNVLAIIAGVFLGGVVNMALILISGSIIPLPEGLDNTTMEGLKASMHLFEPRHYIMPFLAHALGTLVGAYVAARLAVTRKMFFALFIGAFFLAGGITNVMQLPAPMWFNILDLVGAYFPMAYLGGKLANR